MVPVRVKFYGTIKNVIKDTDLRIELNDGATIKDLLEYLVERFGTAFSTRVLDSKGRMQSYVRMFLNENDVDNDNLATPLQGSETTAPAEVLVYVIPTYGGGERVSADPLARREAGSESGETHCAMHNPQSHGRSGDA